MIVSLYTVRLILGILGEEDYGIYNVVGGIVLMFSFLSNTLASSSNRYFSFELGRNDQQQLGRVFNISIILYIIVVVIVVLLSESIGLWFLNTKMTIPPQRMYAANWVYQLSILSFCISLLATPHKSMIIANEKMDVYAFVGVLEVVLNLLFVFCLKVVPQIDKLIAYAVLMLLIQFLVNSTYVLYSLKNFKSSRITWYWEPKLAKEIALFSGWNFFGAVSSVVRSQGLNILINVFFNPTINAARGLAYQVSNALNSFSTNFYMAVRPQVTKNYACGRRDETLMLVFRSTKFTFYLMLFLATMVYMFIEPILIFWLKEVPEYTPLFTRIVILTALIDSISLPLMTLAQATGRIALYQSITGTILILNLPISWVLLHFGYPATVTFIVTFALSIVALVARILILRIIDGFPIIDFLRSSLIPIALTSVAVFLTLHCVKMLYSNPSSTSLLICSVISVLISILIIYIVGLSKTEKEFVVSMFTAKFLKK